MTKKNAFFIFLFFMLFSAAKGTTLPPPSGSGWSLASVAPSGQTLYYIIRGDTATVTYPSDWLDNYWGTFTKPTGNLIIPDSVTFWGETYPVTAIGSDAFTYCIGLTSVVIPNTVKYIEDAAFYYTNIISITLSDSLKTIGTWAFKGCNFDSIILPNGLKTIGESAFMDCTNLSSINIPNTVISIEREAFKNCTNLASVTLSQEITVISEASFSGCSMLDSIEIPESVSFISWHAFEDCSNLQSVILMPGTAPNFPSYGVAEIFGNNHSSRVFWIPCGSWDSYYNTWTVYRNALREPSSEISMTISTNDTSRGLVESVYHNAIVGCDSITTITATPFPQYHFDHWSNGSVANPDTLQLIGDSSVTAFFIGVSVNVNDSTRGFATHNKIDDHIERIIATPFEHYHFDHWSNGNTSNPDTLNLVGDSTVIAYFSPNRYHLTVNVNNVNWGSISFPYGDSADYLDTLMIIATPIEHYHVANWGGVSRVSASKDTSWIIMNSDRAISCSFTIDIHTVTAIANNNERGVITGDGEYVYGTPCILTAIPYTGYVFKEWSNGIQTNPYAFQVTEDVELTAIFLSEDEVGINIISEERIDVHSSNGRIVVEGTTDKVRVFDMTGRSVRNEELPTGVYMIKIGGRPARKVVVMR